MRSNETARHDDMPPFQGSSLLCELSQGSRPGLKYVAASRLSTPWVSVCRRFAADMMFFVLRLRVFASSREISLPRLQHYIKRAGGDIASPFAPAHLLSVLFVIAANALP